MIFVIAAVSIGAPSAGTRMSPLSHCLYVSPPLRFGVARVHASARSLRATAVAMNLPATMRAFGSRRTVGRAANVCGLPGVNVCFVSAVFAYLTTRNAITPAARTAPAIQGSHRSRRREDRAFWTTFTAIGMVDDGFQRWLAAAPAKPARPLLGGVASERLGPQRQSRRGLFWAASQ